MWYNPCSQFQRYLGSGIILAKAKLVELDLSDNAFGPNGMEGLTDFLKSESCYSLKELRLNNNGLGITGGKVRTCVFEMSFKCIFTTHQEIQFWIKSAHISQHFPRILYTGQMSRNVSCVLEWSQ